MYANAEFIIQQINAIVPSTESAQTACKPSADLTAPVYTSINMIQVLCWLRKPYKSRLTSVGRECERFSKSLRPPFSRLLKINHSMIYSFILLLVIVIHLLYSFTYRCKLDSSSTCVLFDILLEFVCRFLFSPSKLNLDDSIVETHSLFLLLIKVHASIAKIFN